MEAKNGISDFVDLDDEALGYWQGYVRQLADMLGLKDWRIILLREEDASNCIAACYPSDDNKQASIRFGATFLLETPARQRWVIVHELLHPHFHRAENLVRMASDKFEENSLMQVLPGLVKAEIELGVDGVSLAIAPLFPLPPERN